MRDTAAGRPAVPPRLLRRPVPFLALGFGAGLSPYAPGTAGTLVAVPLYWGLALFPGTVYAAVVTVMFAVGIWLCHRAAVELGVADHPAIVWDEIVGFLVTMIPVPRTWFWVVAGFALFRLFDIVKPWPIRWLDRNVPGGFGIMVDDLLAGAYGAAVLWILARAGVA
ncbi:MAG: phosphatidylglycerophosphatase A [Chromatiales bacterium 21-64-14]|nr:MAG: phosphatidylglycerophosphatase A [Chromatiales bacterium 21-64-14]HQU15570.1 phosphatidylglycerophosphatase A [Gammaproteobacteria bacterium]